MVQDNVGRANKDFGMHIASACVTLHFFCIISLIGTYYSLLDVAKLIYFYAVCHSPFVHISRLLPLFRALVDLLQEDGEDLLLQSLALVDLVDLAADLIGTLLLKFFVALLELHVVVKLLDNGLLGIILLAVVLLEDLALFGGGNLESLVDEPRALVILDIGTDLANVLGKTKVVEVVILDLEVFAEGDEDILGLLEVLGGGKVELVECKSDGEVEGVVSGLVDDNELVLLHGEVVKVDLVLRGGQQVAELAHLGLEGSLMEELKKVNIGRVGAEELLEESVDDGLEHESIVDGDHTNTILAVPAGLATAGDAAVHNVVGDEEEGLEELSHPAKSGRSKVLFLGERFVEQERDGVGNRHAAVAFSAKRVDLEVLFGGQQLV